MVQRHLQLVGGGEGARSESTTVLPFCYAGERCKVGPRHRAIVGAAGWGLLNLNDAEVDYVADTLNDALEGLRAGGFLPHGFDGVVLGAGQRAVERLLVIVGPDEGRPEPMILVSAGIRTDVILEAADSPFWLELPQGSDPPPRLTLV